MTSLEEKVGNGHAEFARATHFTEASRISLLTLAS